jgi:hypothetical protein
VGGENTMLALRRARRKEERPIRTGRAMWKQ